MAAVFAITNGVDIKALTFRFADVASDVPAASADDFDVLSLEIRHAGKRMEAAYAAGNRTLAQVWMECMYGLIKARNASIPGPDIKAGGVA